MEPNPAVEVHALRHCYGDRVALQDIDFTVNAGEIFGLLGPNGGGKSTLFRILATLITPTGGSAKVLSLDVVRDAPAVRRRIGVVFQSPSLFPALTAAQNISLPMILAGELSSADRTAALLLDTFGLDELADKLPEELSGGQAQRIAMARALAIGPKLILADEPTGQLDSVTAQLFFDTVLSHLENTGIALVVATHDEAVAARMATRWTMEHGRLTLQSLQTGAS